MRIKLVGTRQASQAVRDFMSRPPAAREAAVPVTRQEQPYSEQAGWVQYGNRLTGAYHTPYGSFCGQIELHAGGDAEFFLYQPSEAIMRHSHWVCFQQRGGNGWYFVHMGRRPKDVSSGILTIERLITEAYENY